jgi:hypothetical protein
VVLVKSNPRIKENRVSGKGGPKTLVEAVQLVFDALEPFDDAARQRILTSAVSLLGGTAVTAPSGLSTSRATVQATPLSADRPLSPVELIQQKSPATNPQRLALFAYYRDKVEGLSRFSKEDLRLYFAKAKQPSPQNYDRDYNQAVKLGWIYDDDADSYITSKGIEAVEAGFDGKGRPRGASVSKSGRGKKAKQKKQRK